MKKYVVVLCIIYVTMLSCGIKKEMGTQADRDEITAIAHDYMDGWYEGNADRMDNVCCSWVIDERTEFCPR